MPKFAVDKLSEMINYGKYITIPLHKQWISARINLQSESNSSTFPYNLTQIWGG